MLRGELGRPGCAGFAGKTLAPCARPVIGLSLWLNLA